jgi:acetyl-CoA carboxylase carboxyl transferase subunit alpha
MATRLKTYLSRTLAELEQQDTESLLEARYEKFRRMGMFLEEPVVA